MRAFHMSWLAFFLCFFAWFGIAPLMPVVRKELKLSPVQIGNILIASVSITIVARMLIGWICDRVGPRITYTWLLILGAIPVIGIGFAHSYQSFLFFRLAIGAIGASFVITQYHTSLMFAPNIVGTANATTAGWGNMGGGATQILMPLIFGAFVALETGPALGWRVAMIVPGAAMLLCAIGYYRFTQDTPQGNFADLRAKGTEISGKKGSAFLEACRDKRVWALAAIYGASFGIEITIHNVAALYFTDSFHVGLKAGGLIVGAFGMLAIFARSLGGWLSDVSAARFGLASRGAVLGVLLLVEGIMLVIFSQSATLPLAVTMLIVFGLFVHMSCGSTYALIPFINRKAVGSVAGIVGAGGNVGAMLSGFLFKGSGHWAGSLLILGVIASACSLFTLLVRVEPDSEPLTAPRGARAGTPLDEQPALA